MARSPLLSSVTFASLILLAHITRLVSATCYWQNSTLAPNDPFSIATDDTACFPDQDNSPCCGTGWTCLSNGVCFIEQGDSDFYYRGTCTDRTWDSQQCPGWCFAQNANSSIPLAKCQKESGEDWYCCPGDANCDCDTGTNAVKLGATQPTTVTVIGSTSWPGMTSTTTPFSASSPLVTEGTSTDQVTTATDGSVTTSVPTFSGTTDGLGTSAAVSATSSPPSESNGSSGSIALAAGLGAGLGGAAVLVIFLGFFLIRSRRRKTAERKAASEAKDGGPAPHGMEPVPYSAVAGSYAYHENNQNRGMYKPPVREQSELPSTGSNLRSEMPADSVGRPSIADRSELAG